MNQNKNPYYLVGAQTATLTSGAFKAITMLTAQTITVKGGGVYNYVSANGGTGNYLDSNGAVLGATHAAGFYEAVGSFGVTIGSIPAGVTIYGRFTSVASGTNEKSIAYK